MAKVLGFSLAASVNEKKARKKMKTSRFPCFGQIGMIGPISSLNGRSQVVVKGERKEKSVGLLEAGRGRHMRSLPMINSIIPSLLISRSYIIHHQQHHPQTSQAPPTRSPIPGITTEREENEPKSTIVQGPLHSRWEYDSAEGRTSATVFCAEYPFVGGICVTAF